MPQEHLLIHALYTKVNRKRPVGLPQTRLDYYNESCLEPLTMLSKRNAVCVGGQKGVMTLFRAIALANLNKKQVKKKG